MLKFAFANGPEAHYHILCLGAHSDDIEIGCGGTLLRLAQEYRNLKVTWIVFSADAVRAKEACASANAFLTNARQKTVIVKNFRDGYFPYIGAEIKDYFDQLKREQIPDLIFTHYRADLHQDHRCISDLTWNTFRNHLILEYEISKYDGDLGTPNIFVPQDAATRQVKIMHLLAHFKSQQDKHWFTADAFTALMRLRGIECGTSTGYAEAFHGRKLVLMEP